MNATEYFQETSILPRRCRAWNTLKEYESRTKMRTWEGIHNSTSLLASSTRHVFRPQSVAESRHHPRDTAGLIKWRSYAGPTRMTPKPNLTIFKLCQERTKDLRIAQLPTQTCILIPSRRPGPYISLPNKKKKHLVLPGNLWHSARESSYGIHRSLGSYWAQFGEKKFDFSFFG